MEKKLKGMFFTEIVDAVKKKLGAPGLATLAERYGEPLSFSAFRDYPLEKDLRLLSAGAELLFGPDLDHAYYEMGKLSWQTFVDSLVGKTVISLYAHDLKTAALSIAKLWGTITNFGERTCKELEGHRLQITIQNDPRPMKYLEGVIAGAQIQFEGTPRIGSTVLSENCYQFTLTYNPK